MSQGSGWKAFCSWLGSGRAQLPYFRAASYSDPASVAQLEGTEIRLWDELPGRKGARRGTVRPGPIRWDGSGGAWLGAPAA